MDLGGIAKGYAVKAIAKWLKKYNHSKFGIVDGGGDIAVWSNGEKTWKIGVMDPFNKEKEIGSVEIQNGGIATSNIVYRSWWQDGRKNIICWTVELACLLNQRLSRQPLYHINVWTPKLVRRFVLWKIPCQLKVF